MEFLGTKMNLRLAIALVAGAAVFAAAADSSPAVKGADKKPGSGPTALKKLDPATKDKLEKEKRQFDTKHAENKRRDFVEMNAKFKDMRAHRPHEQTPSTAGEKGESPAKNDGKKSQRKIATASFPNPDREKVKLRIQKEEEDAKLENAKDMERLKRNREESESRRAKVHSEKKASKPANENSPPLPKQKGGK